jgi:osmoprotectant transport system permease protein
MRELMQTYGASLLKAIGIHTVYVLVSVAIGFALGLLLGILLSRKPKWSFIVLPIVSIFQTIPGLVFIGVLFIWIGMKPVTVIIALAVYAMFPVMKNTYTGILEIDPKYIDTANGCGMTSMQRLIHVELPLAMPTIIAGLRMATVYTVSWAVLAAMIGLGGLGDFIYLGTYTNNNTLILLGAIPAAILAVVLTSIIDHLQKKVTPRGLQKGGRS